MPHEIRIDLGASYNLTAFQYLPRQDGSANGWIKDYEFYVSTDGVNWGSAVIRGNFRLREPEHQLSGTGRGNTLSARASPFPQTTGTLHPPGGALRIARQSLDCGGGNECARHGSASRPATFAWRK